MARALLVAALVVILAALGPHGCAGRPAADADQSAASQGDNPRAGGYKFEKEWNDEAAESVRKFHDAHFALLKAQDMVEGEARRLTETGLTGDAHARALAESFSASALRKRRALLGADADDLPELHHFDLARRLQAYGTPRTWDSRSSGLVTPGRNQGSCGTCAAFASTAVMETAYAVTMAKNANDMRRLSPQAFYFCNSVTPLNERVCEGDGAGLSRQQQIDIISQQGGAKWDACFPYKAAFGDTPDNKAVCDKPGCEQPYGPPGTFKPLRFLTDDRSAAEEIASAKEHIWKYGSLSTSVFCNNDFPASYAGSYVIKQEGPNNHNTGHALQVVGYNDEEQYWIFKNSWGQDWGTAGFGKIAYGGTTVFMTQYSGALGVTYTKAGDEKAQQGAPVSDLPAVVFNPQCSGPQVVCTATSYDLKGEGGDDYHVHRITPALNSTTASMAWELPDLSYANTPSGGIADWDHLISSYNLTCTCSNTASPNDCYMLAKDLQWSMYADTFGDMTAATGSLTVAITSPSQCTATSCTLLGDMPCALDNQVESMAITWRMPGYMPPKM